MKNLYLTLLIVTLAILSVGCGTSSSTATVTTQTAARQEKSHNWTIELLISGGIAGLQRQLTINDSGEWHASDRKQGQKGGKLSAEQLTQLDTTLSLLEPTPEQQNRPSFPGRCADCIQTRINVVMNGQRYTATVLSGNTLKQPYADLIAQLSPLMQATFSNP